MEPIPINIIDPYSNVTLILSIIGCVTGMLGFAIGLFHLIKESPNIKIKFDENYCFFFNRLPEYENFDTTYQAIVNVTLINNSTHPITISALYFQYYNAMIFPEFIQEKIIYFIECVNDEGKLQLALSLDQNQLTFPLKLNPYDSVCGLIFIPFFEESTAPEKYVNYHLKTSRKDLKGKCLFHKKTIDHDESHHNKAYEKPKVVL